MDRVESGVASANAALRAAGAPGLVPDVAGRLRLRHLLASYNLRP